MAEEDIRQVELSTIASIYPELQIDENDPYKISIEMPVSLANPVVVFFPAANEGAPSVEPVQGRIPVVTAVDLHALSNLPSLHIVIQLPDKYPLEEPPRVDISVSPPWLPGHILRKLETEVVTLWEEIGHDQVIFTYLDNLQQSSETVFGLVDDGGRLRVGLEHKIEILDYDIKAKQRAFDKETFNCDICLDPQKGSVCHKMLDCGHVFCVQCLQDFYNNAITEGDIASIRCLQPKCAKEREDAVKGSSRKKKAKTFISPSELLQIPLERDMVMRYVTLRHKNELESDKNTVYCPRSWCQGAARSKKHKKPKGLEFVEPFESDIDDIAEDDTEKKESAQDLLAICEDCEFAFCTRCQQSWHGEFKYCIPKERRDEITEEEKASLEYLKAHTTPCPTCDAPCQKTQGCNHMCCFKCQTHFCYLCSAWLDPSNPYRHYNIPPSGEKNDCYMRLWELNDGDGGEAGIRHEGNGIRNIAAAPGRNEQHLEIVQRRIVNEPDEADGEALVAAERQQPRPRPGQRQLPRNQPNGRVAVAREGPLVLRIEGDVPPAQDLVRRRQPGIPNNHGEVHAFNVGLRGGRGNRRGRGPGVNRQNNRNRLQGQNQQINNNGRNGQNRMGEDDVLRGDGQLDARDEAWVRQFVQLALNDQEDLVEDSDDD
ncbi:E3 ubiquitin-protein ligase itt1 [Daldinia childiae]|uniref:E3 ubiquitin-protein ligase itt1 n=1 Tax=Daldinia childiae TaxID=326645 RepID=UPI0014474B99|nr:E3 ubiquitin-protein ligase itt1 [Daldinia childiae]KAF3065067.1 E3 ubiquitin-protein ligase itt1 [Daldinia childiae]